MPCRDKRYMRTHGLNVDTWSGLTKDEKDEPKEVCSLTDATQAYHFVEVKNYRTYKRTVTVRGLISSNINRARFDGPVSIVLSEKQWKDDHDLYACGGSAKAHIWTFQDAELKKKINGAESIQTELDYEDSTSPGVIVKAISPQSPLVFTIWLQ